MRLPICLFAAALALGGCSQTGQTGMQASFAPAATTGGEAIGQSAEHRPASNGFGGIPEFFAPSPQVQVAQIFEHIPGDFKAPDDPPIPPARPDFGDRIQIAAAPQQPAPQQVAAQAQSQATQTAAPAVTEATGTIPPVINAPQPAVARAEAASLGAYEFKTAGIPLPEGGLRATNVAFAPAQFELAGVGASLGRSGGVRWRAAYDNVQTNCFPETLRRALDQLANHFKSEVLVTSGMRERGRRGSLHRTCKAADIRIAGVAPSEVARVARNIPGINGVGTYRRVGVTHIDVRAERFAWRW
jgi:hypothetical protein